MSSLAADAPSRPARAGSTVPWALGATAALAAAVLASLCIGERLYSPVTVIRALVDPSDDTASVIVRDARWPRTLIGAVVGAALGAAGALSQAVTRNPLASPGTLGLAHGAGVAVVALTWATEPTPRQMAIAAVVGATLAAVVVFGVAAGDHADTASSRLVLAGIGVTGMSLAVAQMLLVLDESTFEQIRRWVMGSVADRPASTLWPLLPLLVVGAGLALALGPALDALATGHDMATGLGQRVWRTIAGSGLSICLLTGAAVAAAGPIVFVGLVVPHVARHRGQRQNRAVVARSLLLGAVLVIVADTVGRRSIAHHELPVGVVTALVGGPVFVLVARRSRP